jgi:ribonuclease E
MKKPAEDAGGPSDRTAPVEAPPTPELGGAARGRRSRRGRAPRGAPKPAKTAEAARAAPVSSKPEVVATGEEVVIRFPPVAPSPFPATPTPPVAKAPAEPRAPKPAPAPSAAPLKRIEPPAAPPAIPKARSELLPPPTAPPPKKPAPQADEEPQLTRSQRRRLRRKRRKDKNNGSPPPVAAVAAPATPAAPKRPPPPTASDERRAAPERPRPEELDLEPIGSPENGEEPPAWLEDVAVVHVEAEEEGAEEPEVIEPPPEETEARVAREPLEPEAEADQEGAALQDKTRRRRRRGRRSGRHETAEGPAAITAVEPGPETAAPSGGKRDMIINTVQREECRIAILDDGRLEEIYLERAAAENHVGNIYKGVVTNVEPSIQAAFIDFGQGKNGFLHISDLHPQYFPDGGGQTENVGRKMPRRNRPPIQRCLRRNQEMLVQVTKEGIGTKGPTLSTYLSIPGRFLVMMPSMRRLGVSRRIEDDGARDKLRDVLAELDLPEGMGFIARTAAVDRNKRELQNDLSYLTRLWKAVDKRIKHDPAPAELYRESDLVIRTIRDVFTNDIERIVVDDEEVLNRAREFLSIFSPRSQDIVTLYTDPEPIFHKYKIEAELERLHSRHVPLKSGGSLVIDQTEALVAIDVNSGRFRTEDDAEATAYKLNIEAADEIPRQLRLRDLGGVIVCDFIDMRMESHRREIERRLIENLKQHKERAKVLRTSAFGLIEMTRQRQRASLTRSVYRDCRHCRGTGLVKTVESVTLDVMRLIQLAVTREQIRMVEVTVSPEVAYLLQNRKRALIYDLETKYRRIVSIRPEPNFSLDQVEISCTDARGRVVPHM